MRPSENLFNMFPLKQFFPDFCLSLLCAGIVWMGLRLPASAETNVFFTRFEAAENYTEGFTLVGQNGWISSGSGGNGIEAGLLSGQGQQAWIGAYEPDPGDDQLVVWKPIDFNPVAAKLPIVKFSVLMSIEDSTNEQWDSFRWSVYNITGNRLFSIDFDNYYYVSNVSYILDGANPLVVTPVSFTNSLPQTLTLTMNFASNRWSATLDDALIATNQPLTTTGLPLTLGDIDAVWLLFDTNAPGDNYMVFDNYRIAAGPPPPRLQLLGRAANGQVSLRLWGDSDWRFAIEATTNFNQWTALKTNPVVGGFFDYLDTSAAAFSRRYYRARWVP